MVDRRGARAVLTIAILCTGLATLGLSLTSSLAMFYVIFCFARMVWAGPFDLGLYTALNNWFVSRRGIANSIASLAQMAGLVVLPLVAQLAMEQGSWRNGWLAIGALSLLIGLVPVWLLVVRRPEDLGLAADRPRGGSGSAVPEPQFDRRQAMATRAFWLLSLYTVLVYPVQAGVSLHQVSHLIERGLAPLQAAGVVGVFSSMSALSGFAIGFLPRRISLQWRLIGTAACLSLGTAAMIFVHDIAGAYLAAGVFGLGIGGIIALLPIAWAEFFGRTSYGAIRGVVLSMQVVAQALGPLLSGWLRDQTGDYRLSLGVLAISAALAIFAALLARRPESPVRSSL